jgi:hypothetical protein
MEKSSTNVKIQNRVIRWKIAGFVRARQFSLIRQGAAANAEKNYF